MSMPGSGGLQVTAEMLEILRQPGYLSIPNGGQKLRELYHDQSSSFNCRLLSDFAFACCTGSTAQIKQAVEAGMAPDLTGTETAFKFGYATFVIAGAQRIAPIGPVSAPLDHAGALKYLLSRGAPPDVEDIVGYTALNHATMKHNAKLDLARILLESGAEVNHRNRYGETPVLATLMTNQVGSLDLLLEFGADLDVPDADGITAGSTFITHGPQVTAVITRWIRKRNGEVAPMDGKKCENCGRQGGGEIKLMLCGNCKTVWYHSTDCQRAHWKTHKPFCQPFSSPNSVTLRPYYRMEGEIMSSATLVRQTLGIPTDPVPPSHTRTGNAPKSVKSKPKSMVIKIQIPYNPTGDQQSLPASTGDFLVYTKKRDFICTIRRIDDPTAYDRVSQIVKSRGVGGAKAYFAAELVSKDKLTVKVSEVLAEQPF